MSGTTARDVSNDVVPYDKAWRTRANGSTVLTTDADLVVGGRNVPKGSYVVQTLPGRTGWKLLIQKNIGQSPAEAATTYNPANDVARVDLRQVTLASSVETLTFWLIPSRDAGNPHGKLVLAWGNVALSTD